LPNDKDWRRLVSTVGRHPGRKLKSKTGWNSNGNGVDEFGFSAMPGGERRLDGSFNHVGRWGSWWSAAERAEGRARSRSMGWETGGVAAIWCDKAQSFSVRCLQDVRP
jgi:uncharacterized protein (TIGR02145 family)